MDQDEWSSSFACHTAQCTLTPVANIFSHVNRVHPALARDSNTQKKEHQHYGIYCQRSGTDQLVAVKFPTETGRLSVCTLVGHFHFRIMSTHKNVIVSALLLVLVPSHIHGRSDGAPNDACASMIPAHGVNAQSSPSPFSTLPNEVCIKLKYTNFQTFPLITNVIFPVYQYV